MPQLKTGLYRWPSLSDIHLATLTGHGVYHWSPKSQVILHWTEEAGNLTRQQANSFDVVFGQHSAEPVVCRLDILQESEVGLSFGFEVLTARLGAHHFWLRLYPFSLEVVLTKPSLSHRALPLCTKLREWLVCERDGGVI
jgi:hypothetical protein